ncbi:MAG: DUF3638 domain-containing protein [Candidatus Margulisiibacteriota bacterium]|jgi:hypothetical protein
MNKIPFSETLAWQKVNEFYYQAQIGPNNYLFDWVSGVLFLNRQPLGQLPIQFYDAPDYKALFQEQKFPVAYNPEFTGFLTPDQTLAIIPAAYQVPSSAPSSSASSSSEAKKSQMLLQIKKMIESESCQFIPLQSTRESILPQSLIENHEHWLSDNNQTLYIFQKLSDGEKKLAYKAQKQAGGGWEIRKLNEKKEVTHTLIAPPSYWPKEIPGFNVADLLLWQAENQDLLLEFPKQNIQFEKKAADTHFECSKQKGYFLSFSQQQSELLPGLVLISKKGTPKKIVVMSDRGSIIADLKVESTKVGPSQQIKKEFQIYTTDAHATLNLALFYDRHGNSEKAFKQLENFMSYHEANLSQFRDDETIKNILKGFLLAANSRKGISLITKNKNIFLYVAYLQFRIFNEITIQQYDDGRPMRDLMAKPLSEKLIKRLEHGWDSKNSQKIQAYFDFMCLLCPSCLGELDQNNSVLPGYIKSFFLKQMLFAMDHVFANPSFYSEENTGKNLEEKLPLADLKAKLQKEEYGEKIRFEHGQADNKQILKILELAPKLRELALTPSSSSAAAASAGSAAPLLPSLQQVRPEIKLALPEEQINLSTPVSVRVPASIALAQFSLDSVQPSPAHDLFSEPGIARVSSAKLEQEFRNCAEHPPEQYFFGTSNIEDLSVEDLTPVKANLNQDKENLTGHIAKLTVLVKQQKAQISELLKLPEEKLPLKDLQIFFFTKNPNFLPFASTGMDLNKLSNLLGQYLLFKTQRQQFKRALEHLEKFMATSDLEEAKDHLKNYTKEISAPRAYSPNQHPEYLVFEAVCNIRLYQEQKEKLDVLLFTYLPLIQKLGQPTGLEIVLAELAKYPPELQRELSFLRTPGLTKEQAIQFLQEHCGRIMQFIMGKGKSKIIMPLLGLSFANQGHFVVLTVPDPLLGSTRQDISAKYWQPFNRVTYTFQLTRQKMKTNHKARDWRSSELEHELQKLSEAKAAGHVIITSPKHLQILINLYIEYLAKHQQTKSDEEIKKCLFILKDIVLLFKNSIQIMDEVDLILRPDIELNLPLGAKKTLTDDPSRLILPGSVFSFLANHAAEFVGISGISPVRHEQNPEQIAGIFLTDEKYYGPLQDRLIAEIAKDDNEILGQNHGLLSGLKVKEKELMTLILPHYLKGGFSSKKSDYQAALVLAVQLKIPGLDLASLRKSDSKPNRLILYAALNQAMEEIINRQPNKKMVYLCKEWISSFLPHILQKRLEVDFGVRKDSDSAIPWLGVNTPSPTSEFANPDITIGFSYLQYYYKGLSEDNIAKILDHMKNSANKEQGTTPTQTLFSSWVHDLNLADLKMLDLNDSAKVKALHKLLTQNKKVINYFLETIIFPKELQYFEFQISSNAQDLAGKLSSAFKIGFTGTSEEETCPEALTVHADGKTNAEMITVLTTLGKATVANLSAAITPREILSRIDFSTHNAFIDAGGLITGMTNLEIAKLLLKQSENTRIQAIVYYDDATKEQMILKQGQAPQLLAGHDINPAYRFTFYDHVHTTGADISQKFNTKAYLTIGKSMVFRDLIQSAMRLRKLAGKQSLSIFLPEDIDNQVKFVMQNAGKTEISDIIKFLYYQGIERLKSKTFKSLNQQFKQVVREIAFNMALENPEKDFTNYLIDKISQDIETVYSHLASEQNPQDYFLKLENQYLKQLYELFGKAETNPQYLAAKAKLETILRRSLALFPESLPSLVSLRTTTSSLDAQEEREQEQEKEQEIDNLDRTDIYHEASWDKGYILTPDFWSQVHSLTLRMPAGTRLTPAFANIKMSSNFAQTKTQDDRDLLKMCNFAVEIIGQDQQPKYVLVTLEEAEDLRKWFSKQPQPTQAHYAALIQISDGRVVDSLNSAQGKRIIGQREVALRNIRLLNEIMPQDITQDEAALLEKARQVRTETRIFRVGEV